MNLISNYTFYTTKYSQNADAKNSENKSESTEVKTETTTTTEVVNQSNNSEDSKYFLAKAWDEQNNSSKYIQLSSQPLNKTLTSYRDKYPNIIGFTAKTQSSLRTLGDEYITKLQGLTSQFANCKTQDEFDSKMRELKSKISQLMKEYQAKYNDIFAIVSALPALSEVRDKLVGTDLNMHDELDEILKNVSNYDDSKTSASSNTKSTFGNLDKNIINTKMQDLKIKNNEYKEKLKKAQESKNETEIDENESLIYITQKMIDVYSTVLKGFDSVNK